MADVFISYSHFDKERADEVVSRIRDCGWTVWIDDGLEGGRDFREEIAAELAAAGVVVVLWSQHSCNSNWCKDEADRALQSNPPKLLAARLDDVVPPLGHGQLHAVGLLSLRPGEPHPGVNVLLEQIRGRIQPEPIRFNVHAEAYRRLKQLVRHSRNSLLLALVLAFSTIYLLSVGAVVPHMRLLSLVARRWCADAPRSDALRVVLIDRETEAVLAKSDSAEQFGRSWRQFHARVIGRLAAAEAKVIAFDIAFGGKRESEEPYKPEHDTLDLADAVRAARKKNTAVFIIAKDRDADHRLAVEPEVAKALNELLDGMGGVGHPCMGAQEGWANLAPLVFTESDSSAVTWAISLVSYSALMNSVPNWDPGSERLTLTSPGHVAVEIPISGLGRMFVPEKKGCAVAAANERPVQRILEPFPQDLDRNDERVIPFETVLANNFDASRVKGKLVLVGVQLDDRDQHRVCDSDGCHNIAGLALQATAIDTLSSSEVIRVIMPSTQLIWLVVSCLAVAWFRFAGVRSSKLFRLGSLASFMALDVLLAWYLAAEHALLVDSLHHLFAMALTYYFVTRLDMAELEPNWRSTAR